MNIPARGKPAGRVRRACKRRAVAKRFLATLFAAALHFSKYFIDLDRDAGLGVFKVDCLQLAKGV
jgi:hypothetical protein